MLFSSPTSLFAFTNLLMRLFRATPMQEGMWSGAMCEMHFQAALMSLNEILVEKVIINN